MTAVSARQSTTHRITVAAPAGRVYDLVADVANWPRVFPPTIWVDHLERGDGQERIRIWATANGEVKSWVSRRTLDPAARRVTFRQEVSAAPVASMGGTWIIEEISPAETSVVLEHDFTAVGDDPANVAWIERAIDHNSHAELEALKAAAEPAPGGESPTLTFADTITFEGDGTDVFEFIDRAGLWTERLPHVARVELTEDTPGVQTLEMDTRTADGSTHTTKSIRVCFPHHLIVYKQLGLPALLSLHTGRWLIDGDTLTSEHTITIKTEAIPTILGPDATLADAKEYVRKALSGNSTATMRLAGSFAAQAAAG